MKIFRKIRQKVLLENPSDRQNGKFSKPASPAGRYFIYAIGEIVLVVIGILIALQINNWNETKKDDKALKEYLVKIKSHTLEDLRKLDTISIGRTQIAEICKKARMRILDKTEDQDLLLLKISGLAFADFYFKPSTGGYEALKNSSYFGKINNTPLDSLLTKYHSLVDEISENEKSYNQYVESQEAYLSTQFDRSLILASAFLPLDSLTKRATPQSEYDEDFKEYTASAPYRNVISLAAFQFDAMISQYNQLNNVGLNVIEEIDAITND